MALTDSPETRLDGTNANPENSRWGVILLCHGSQRGSSKGECSCAWVAENGNSPDWCRNCSSTSLSLSVASDRLQTALGESAARVILSCLEFIQPHPPQAVQMLVDQGLRQLVIMPYLRGHGKLGHSKHATEEMAEVPGDLRANLPQVRLEPTEGLGADPRIADLVVERVHDLDGVAPAPDDRTGDVGVMLDKAGTRTQYDDCHWMQELGRMVEQRLGMGYAVEVAQSHYGDPTMSAAAARLVEERQVAAVIFVPYLFFPGLIRQRNVMGGIKGDSAEVSGRGASFDPAAGCSRPGGGGGSGTGPGGLAPDRWGLMRGLMRGLMQGS